MRVKGKRALKSRKRKGNILFTEEKGAGRRLGKEFL